MRYLKLLLLMCAVTFTAVCHSAEFWSGKTKITNLYPASTTYVFNVTYSNPLSTCDHGTRFSISTTNPNYNSLVSTLIAAFMAQKEININVDDSQGAGCQPSANRFIVYP